MCCSAVVDMPSVDKLVDKNILSREDDMSTEILRCRQEHVAGYHSKNALLKSRRESKMCDSSKKIFGKVHQSNYKPKP